MVKNKYNEDKVIISYPLPPNLFNSSGMKFFNNLVVLHLPFPCITLKGTQYSPSMPRSPLPLNSESAQENTTLECVWIEYFNEAIHFFEEFRFLCNEMLCLDREI